MLTAIWQQDAHSKNKLTNKLKIYRKYNAFTGFQISIHLIKPQVVRTTMCPQDTQSHD